MVTTKNDLVYYSKVNIMKQIKGYMSTFQKRMTPYCIEFDDCYDIVKRNGGWAIKKNGEFIDNYCYGTKWVAASKIGKFVNDGI